MWSLASIGTSASSSSSSSSSFSISFMNMLSPLPIVTLCIVSMLILCGVATAFRSTSSAVGRSIGSNAISASSPRTDSSNRTTPTSTRHPDRQSRVSSSTVGGAVQAASDTMRRHRRTYWDELAPPFGIRGGLLKRRRKRIRRKRRRSGGRGESGVADATHDADETEVDTGTIATARSIAKGRIIGDVKQRYLGDDTEMDSHGQANYVSLLVDDSLEYMSDHTWEENDDDTTASGDSDYATTPLSLVSGENKTSICFLVHGHRGLSRDLGYLRAAMHGRLSEERRHRRKELRENKKSAGSDSAVELSCSSLGHDVVVHSAVCNEGRTEDGVRAGGERLVEEMLQVIRTAADRKRRQKKSLQESKAGDNKEEDGSDELAVDVTVSLIGNSLGGIYSRYAVAQLFHMSDIDIDGNGANDNDSVLLDNGTIRLHFQTFCTTATPHLGCARHTWISLPRSAERAVGHILGETGRDLFRMSSLLHEMSTDEYYLSPLRQFRKRVAYANGYHTDFPVPAATAAFLHEDSEYPHHFREESMSNADSELDKYIVATLFTQPASSLGGPLEEDCDDDLKMMSTALDSLGWKKVIVDLRHEISFRLSVPRVLRSNSLLKKKRSLSSFGRGFRDSAERSSSDDKSVLFEKQQEQLLREQGIGIIANGDGGNDDDRDEPMMNSTLADSRAHRESLRRKAIIASRDAKAAFASPRDGSIHLPVGHNMICAFSRGRVSSHMNRGGRPVMDSLAREMVDDMLSLDSAVESSP